MIVYVPGWVMVFVGFVLYEVGDFWGGMFLASAGITANGFVWRVRWHDKNGD